MVFWENSLTRFHGLLLKKEKLCSQSQKNLIAVPVNPKIKRLLRNLDDAKCGMLRS